MHPSQYGHLVENLVEAVWTVGTDGRLVTYIPVLDSRGVDRAVSLPGAAPLFIQVKAHQRERRGRRLSFAVPEAEIGRHGRWYALLVHSDGLAITDAWLVPSADLVRLGAAGHTAGGVPAIEVTVSPTSPTWTPFAVPADSLGPTLEALAGAPARELAPIEELRSQEEGGFFEAWLLAQLLGHAPELAVYRPAVDLGRDLLVQRAGTSAALFIQVKGTTRDDRPGLARFQVRRRTFDPTDPLLAFAFVHATPTLEPDVAWLVPAAALNDRTQAGDPDHLSFEAHLNGPDPRWSEFRLPAAALSAAITAMAMI